MSMQPTPEQKIESLTWQRDMLNGALTIAQQQRDEAIANYNRMKAERDHLTALLYAERGIS